MLNYLFEKRIAKARKGFNNGQSLMAYGSQIKRIQEQHTNLVDCVDKIRAERKAFCAVFVNLWNRCNKRKKTQYKVAVCLFLVWVLV